MALVQPEIVDEVEVAKGQAQAAVSVPDLRIAVGTLGDAVNTIQLQLEALKRIVEGL